MSSYSSGHITWRWNSRYWCPGLQSRNLQLSFVSRRKDSLTSSISLQWPSSSSSMHISNADGTPGMDAPGCNPETCNLPSFLVCFRGSKKTVTYLESFWDSKQNADFLMYLGSRGTQCCTSASILRFLIIWNGFGAFHSSKQEVIHLLRELWILDCKTH